METIQVASVPVSQKHTLGPLARDFRTALSYLSFYSADSPFVLQSIQKLHRALQGLQSSIGTLVVHMKEGILHLNDLPMGDAGDLARYLKEKGLLGLEFPAGSSTGELVTLLKRLTLPVSAGPLEVDPSMRIRPIPADVLLEILPGESPREDAEASSPEEAPAPEVPPAGRALTARHPLPASFADLDSLTKEDPIPASSPSVVPAPAPHPASAPVADEALLSFVAEAWQYSLSQRKALGPSADSAALAGSFEKLFFRLLDRMERTTPGFEQITRWFKAPAGEWMEPRTSKAMLPLMEAAIRNDWTSVLFDPATEGLVGDCLAHWGSQGKEDLVERTVTRLSEALTGDLLERQLALAHLMDARPWIGNPVLLEKVLIQLNSLLSRETLPSPYQSALLLAWDLTGPSLSSGKEGPVLTLLSTLHFHADEDHPDFQERSRIARHWLFERSNPELVRALARCAQKAGTLDHFPLLGELAAPILLGDFLAAPPLDRVDYFPLFGSLKEPMRSTLAEFFAETGSEEEVRPMLPLLRVVGLDPGLSLQLCAWISRGSRALRTEILSLLEEIADPAGGLALRLALFDDHAETAALAAQVMGKIGYRPGVPVLLKAVQVRKERPGDHEPFLVAACKALGKLGDEKAVPFLEEVARKKPLFRGKAYPESVRVAAIEGLAHMDQPQVWRFLENLTEERNGAVQEVLERVTKERMESLQP